MKTVINSQRLTVASQSGISLLEVLIALVIFALGVVGMAGLQLGTMRVTMDSTQRSYAVAKSQDIADRVRSNGIAPSSYLGTYNDEGDYCTTNEPAEICTDVVGADAVQCTTDQMVAFDLYDAFCTSNGNVGAEKVGNGSLEDEVAEWLVVIGCEFDDGTGIKATTACDELGARVTIETSWFARSFDTDVTTDEPRRDSMMLRFVP